MTGFAFAYAVVRVCGGQPRKNPGAPILYKPTNQLFRNRLEAKLALGHSRYNKIAKNNPDDLVYLNDNSLASDEYLYSNSKFNNTTN